ncbi:MAG TPA: DUF4097 family beta strand repeat-containing protein [Gemmatimonadales bacterium]|nr:DUF4097 family beta strand repeat-containing protein [Gemmatimonadales bacterium]
MSHPVPFLLVTGSLAFAAASAAAQQPSRHTLPGQQVSLYNLAGAVRLDPGSGSAVIAEVTPRGADAARLTVETGTLRGRESLRVMYPEQDILYPSLGRGHRTQFRVYEDGTFFGERRGRGDGREIRIRGDGDGLEAYADMRVLVPAGKSVEVYVGVGSVTVTNVDGDLVVDVAAADVTTSGTRGRLLLDLGSGEVSVTDAQGDLTVDAGSGDVRLTNVRGEKLLLDTGSGTITGDQLVASSILLDTGSGDVSLDGVASPIIELDTGSGTVELGLSSDIETLRLDSGSGDVILRAPASLGARFEAETGSGDISGTLVENLTRREDRVFGTIGDGEGMISIDSGSGDVRLERR